VLNFPVGLVLGTPSVIILFAFSKFSLIFLSYLSASFGSSGNDQFLGLLFLSPGLLLELLRPFSDDLLCICSSVLASGPDDLDWIVYFGEFDVCFLRKHVPV
jgi:hypothetical protein